MTIQAWPDRHRLMDMDALVDQFVGHLKMGGTHIETYDPVCFDTRGRKGRRECPMVLVDHEALLQDETIVVKDTVAESFHSFILGRLRAVLH